MKSHRTLLVVPGIWMLLAGCGGSNGDTAPSPVTIDATTTTPAPDTSTATTVLVTTTSAPAPTTTTVPAPTTTTVPIPVPAAATIEDLLALDRTIVAAHAGGDQDYPHSTPYAFTQAALAGADVLELDVQLTADGVLIVQHDDTVDRTTETTGRVADMTLAQIQALDNAYWFGPGLWGDQTRPDSEYVFRGVRTGVVEPPSGFSADDFIVPTFRQVAERFEGYVLDVEIKLQRGADGEEDPSTGIAAAAVLAREIAELDRQDSVIVASFDDQAIEAFRQLAPGVPTSPGRDAMTEWFLTGTPLDPADRVLQVPYLYEGQELVTADFVDLVHEGGYDVWVWMSGTDVLETTEFYTELLARGVDGVIAGRPGAAVAALSSIAAQDR